MKRFMHVALAIAWVLWIRYTFIGWTADNGVDTVTDTQVVGVASAPVANDPPNKIVVITFADGWKNVFDLGKPIFDKYGDLIKNYEVKNKEIQIFQDSFFQLFNFASNINMLFNQD